MPTAPNSDTQARREGASHPLTYGRRKQIPLILLSAALCAFWLVTTRLTVIRMVEGVLLLVCVSSIYRYWMDPMPPRYAKRLATVRARREGFGDKLWHKLALALIALLVLLMASLIVSAELSR